MEQSYGWDYIKSNIADNYISAIRLFVNNEQEFETFRQKLGSAGGILEGDANCGELWLRMILDKHGSDLLKEKLSLFKRNDIYGGPIIRNYGEYGDVCPFTFLYVWQGLNVINKFKTNKFNKIVEIGTGYGALCIMIDSLCEYEEYVIVDLPEVVELNKKYLSHFPEIYKKVTFIPCNKLTEISNVDLCISCAAISECNTETQLNYFDKIVKNSTLAYFSYNRINYEFFNIASSLFNIDNEGVGGINDYYFTKK
jgi:hypothetical protein